MNPFVHSTVARSLPLAQWRRPRGAQGARCPHSAKRALRRALGVLLLTAGLGAMAPNAHAVDVNQATATQLESIRGIGPRTAEIIVQERERGGAFESLDDLSERVRGIGQKKAQALQAAGLTIGGKAGAAAPAGAAPVSAKPASANPAASRPGSAGSAAAKSTSSPAPARARP
ncbi:helix-hairpin-helix domain-containing protein [Achromobacter sp.]|uniref:ComEA family DNA-binding protein n=1 Tax=Achromobacter sp. TaxID=134375 RepID=UPI0028A63427|nr:helix-hairpin-helix domain-containing protein [Achromobacter sp.]